MADTQTPMPTMPSSNTFNPGYAARPQGMLKISQTVLNIICTSLVGAHFRGKPDDQFLAFIETEHLFFYLMSVTFLIGTIVLLVSSFAASQTAAVLTNSVFEFIYHLTATILYLSASVAMLSAGKKANDMYGGNNASIILAAGAMGLFNTFLYCGSTFLVFKTETF